MIALAAEALTVRRGAAVLLDRVELTARGGEFLAVLGPNGAGKSTLLRALAGVERLFSGRVLRDGADMRALTPPARARIAAYLPQDRDVAWSMTVEAVVALGRYAYGVAGRPGPADRAAVDRAIAAVGIEPLRLRSAHALSGGEAARMHLARALAAETPVLIADEPTSALDLRHQIEIMSLLQMAAAKGGLVVAALHDLELARRFATRALVLDRGRVVADAAPDEALAEPLLRAVFGVERSLEGYALSG